MPDKKSVYFFMLVLEIPLLKTSMDIFLSVLYECLFILSPTSFLKIVAFSLFYHTFLLMVTKPP